MAQTKGVHRILVTFPVGDKEKQLFVQAAPDAEFLFISDNKTDEIRIIPGERLPKEETASTEDVSGRDIIIGNVSPGLLKSATDLKFFQLNSAGTNQYINGVLPDGVTMCCASGAYGIAIAEHMLAMVLALIKRIELYGDNRKEHIWRDEGAVKGIYGSTTLVAGAGNIGTEFARRMKALGSRCIAIRRKPSAPDDIFEECGTLKDIDKYLPNADFVASALPETEYTKGIFDREKFAIMKTGAVFVNVGRGTAVVSDDLTDALNRGDIGGACLDVTHEEPLPEDSSLWDAKNLILTPHVSGGYHMQCTYDQILKIMTENLKNYLSGGRLISEVDPESGYGKRSHS